MSLSLRHIPGTGINSGACHVWDIVGVRWKLRKMDGTIKVRVENGVYEFVGDCFFGVAPPFFLSSGLKCPSVSVCELGPPIWRLWAAFFSRSESGNQISFFSSFFQSIPLPFFTISCPVVRIRYGLDSRLKSESRFGFWGPSAQLRTSGEAQRSE